MTHDEFQIIAADHGFQRVYFTNPIKFDLGANRFHLIADAPSSFPYATCIAVLVYPYAPFTSEERIPAYYLASNRAYHAVNRIISELASAGIRAEKAAIPIKSQLECSHVGVKCKNSLISIEPFGTRTVLLALAIDGLSPIEYDERGEVCGDCSLCIRSCPMGAIGQDGLNASMCMRLHMDTAMHPDWVRNVQKTYIGCEICQYACKRNAALTNTKPADEVASAFELKRLISGDAAEARGFVGRNMSGNGKLTAEAIAFAARDGLYEEEILAASDSPFEAVQDAIRYAKTYWRSCR